MKFQTESVILLKELSFSMKGIISLTFISFTKYNNMKSVSFKKSEKAKIN
jgi:hypothetical protein